MNECHFLLSSVGKPSDVKIKWTGSQASLWYLFKVMMEKGYVLETVAELLNPNFMNTNRTDLTDF